MRADSALVAGLSPSPNFGDRRGKAIDTLILHYTGMRSSEHALARLCDPSSGVSCHYLVWEDGRIEQLVAERHRAWHAGHSSWAGETDMNAASLGVEIVNAGHDGGCPPYPDAQIDAVAALCRDLCTRRAIPPRHVLAHSDIAPERKIDPGEWFPWARLAAAGVGLWVDPLPPDARSALEVVSGPSVLALQKRLSAFGYACPASGALDAPTSLVIAAFQRHYRPSRVDGVADESTLATLEALLGLRP